MDCQNLRLVVKQKTRIFYYGRWVHNKCIDSRSIPISLLPDFFLEYEDEMCFRTVTEIHKLDDRIKKVELYLKIPDKKDYTRHWLRRKTAKLLVGRG